jgi:tRNA nucleotidyltransferase (CCA-adding enzyme)
MADSQGRTGFEKHPYPQKHIFEQAYQAALSVNVQDVIQDGFQGASIRTELEQRRITAIKESGK